MREIVCDCNIECCNISPAGQQGGSRTLLDDGTLVVDGVVHAFNWDEANAEHEWALRMAPANYGMHKVMSTPEATMTEEECLADWQPDMLADVLFKESVVDVAAYHSVPFYDMFVDGMSALWKGAEIKERYPDRIVLYGNVNPLNGKDALREVERQVNEFGISGLKLYPVGYQNGRSVPIRLDDRTYAFPLIEKCIELGIKSIAVHKAAPAGPTAIGCYQVDDFDVAGQFPEMTFEIVHAGMAWVEETCMMLGRYENVVVNLELTSGLVLNRPRSFAEAFGAMLRDGGAERVIFASGCAFTHPQPLVDALLDFEMPPDLVEGHGYPAITYSMKQDILGGAFLRLHGIDSSDLGGQLSQDGVEKQRSGGLLAPWSTLREGAAA